MGQRRRPGQFFAVGVIAVGLGQIIIFPVQAQRSVIFAFPTLCGLGEDEDREKAKNKKGFVLQIVSRLLDRRIRILRFSGKACHMERPPSR
jgi:hypothetical protein